MIRAYYSICFYHSFHAGNSLSLFWQIYTLLWLLWLFACWYSINYLSFYPRFLTESSKSPAYCSSQPPQGTYLIRLNLCIICSMVCIALKVLDWYNLYMDFVGHAVFVPYILYISVFLYAILEAFADSRRRYRYVRKRAHLKWKECSLWW